MPNQKSTIPVIAASMAMPFADEMRLFEKDPGPVLGRFGLAIKQLKDYNFISAQTWYDFVEAAAEAVSDQHFGYRVGSERLVEDLPNVGFVDLETATLGEILTALIIDTQRILTLGTYELTIRASIARIESNRNFHPIRPPAQIDGFFIGFLLNIFRRCVPQAWAPSDLIVSVSDPKALPPEARQECKVLKGEARGTFVQFPTQWLLARTDRQYGQSRVGKQSLDRGFIVRFREILRTRISDPDLNVVAIARLTSSSVSSLQARLNAINTTYSTELRRLRTEHAKALLPGSVSIAEVGRKVGYPDPTAFSRAFKNWTGTTPREYQKRLKSV